MTATERCRGTRGGTISRLEDLTWVELESLLAGGPPVGLLPVGALEAHGPHLPLAADRWIAEAMAEAGASEIERRGGRTLVLPAFVWSPAPFASSFAGTIDARASVVEELLRDVVSSCARWGLRTLVLANAHQDPAHVGMLRRLREASPVDGMEIVYPDLTRRCWAERLAPDFRRGCHAGSWETSVLMAARPELVRNAVRRSLEPVGVSLVEAIGGGARSFLEAGAPDGWVGDPATATAEHGAREIAALGSIVADAWLRSDRGPRTSTPSRTNEEEAAS